MLNDTPSHAYLADIGSVGTGRQNCWYMPSVYSVWVLTGGIPFRGVWRTDLGFFMAEGTRQAKPESTSATSFFDSLWGFVQRCRDGDVELRIYDLGGEIVSCVISDSKWPILDPAQHCESYTYSPLGIAPIYRTALLLSGQER